MSYKGPLFYHSGFQTCTHLGSPRLEALPVWNFAAGAQGFCPRTALLFNLKDLTDYNMFPKYPSFPYKLQICTASLSYPYFSSS